jgi:3,4-dihydroxy 2-butanone 4-phosphate synthase/GTP cyclohydrolase II
VGFIGMYAGEKAYLCKEEQIWLVRVNPPMKQLAETPLPTAFGSFRMIAFESEFPDFPHIAMWSDANSGLRPLNVRVHSECMTGDVFGSRKCDCGEQLHASLELFGREGGMLIYLRQEGRGIGLVNKMKAYNLQQEGLDTIKANHALGFHADERDYAPAIAILQQLGIDQINLYTNNPEKVDAFKDSTIEVMERRPIEVAPHRDNESYLRTKRTDMGHFLRLIS